MCVSGAACTRCTRDGLWVAGAGPKAAASQTVRHPPARARRTACCRPARSSAIPPPPVQTPLTGTLPRTRTKRRAPGWETPSTSPGEHYLDRISTGPPRWLAGRLAGWLEPCEAFIQPAPCTSTPRPSTNNNAQDWKLRGVAHPRRQLPRCEHANAAQVVGVCRCADAMQAVFDALGSAHGVIAAPRVCCLLWERGRPALQRCTQLG